MSTERLTPTSYLVLGLLAREGPSTPYALERHVAATLGNFWSFPHTLLYSEPPRLEALGLVTEIRESQGRRRRIFAITSVGLEVLTAWLDRPVGAPTELRDLGLLQLFFMDLASEEARLRLADVQLGDPWGEAVGVRRGCAHRATRAHLGCRVANGRALAGGDPADGPLVRASSGGVLERCRQEGGRSRGSRRTGRPGVVVAVRPPRCGEAGRDGDGASPRSWRARARRLGHGVTLLMRVAQLASAVRVPPQLPIGPVRYSVRSQVWAMYSEAIQMELPSVTAAP